MRRCHPTNQEFFEKERAVTDIKMYSERDLVNMMLNKGNPEDREYIHDKYPELVLKYPELVA